jgi:hypothetical protein
METWTSTVHLSTDRWNSMEKISHRIFYPRYGTLWCHHLKYLAAIVCSLEALTSTQNSQIDRVNHMAISFKLSRRIWAHLTAHSCLEHSTLASSCRSWMWFSTQAQIGCPSKALTVRAVRATLTTIVKVPLTDNWLRTYQLVSMVRQFLEALSGLRQSVLPWTSVLRTSRCS